MDEVSEWFKQLFPDLADKFGVVGNTAILCASNGHFDGLAITQGKTLEPRENFYTTTSDGPDETMRQIVLFMQAKETVPE